MKTLKFNNPFGLNLENLEFVATYYKGKKGKSIHNYRFLFRGVTSGDEYLLGLEEHSTATSFLGERFLLLNSEDWRQIKPGHLKNKNYNYYLINQDGKEIHNMLDVWRKSNPMVHLGGYQHQRINMISNYSWAVDFDGVRY